MRCPRHLQYKALISSTPTRHEATGHAQHGESAQAAAAHVFDADELCWQPNLEEPIPERWRRVACFVLSLHRIRQIRDALSGHGRSTAAGTRDARRRVRARQEGACVNPANKKKTICVDSSQLSV